ncbi:MAG TPA: hypothetical protein VF704_02965 [Allosphingosinicella sp.]|jgi:hypothetical protein
MFFPPPTSAPTPPTPPIVLKGEVRRPWRQIIFVVAGATALSPAIAGAAFSPWNPILLLLMPCMIGFAANKGMARLVMAVSLPGLSIVALIANAVAFGWVVD